MRFLAFILAGLVCFPVFDFLGSFLPGLILVRFPSTQRLGVRLIAQSAFGCRYCTRYCKGPCDGSCGNWTCSNFK